ncbi:MAG: HAD family hydrolase [Clostridiales bacterium]|nr:HAD family hydrolase [Clostridiales bacterium]
MKYSHIVWDFNGTILDDVWVGIKSVNTLLARRGLPQVESLEQYHSVFQFPIFNYYLQLGFDFDAESYDDLAVEWVEQYMINVRDAGLRPGVLEAIAAFDAAGAVQVLLSATEADMLAYQLRYLGLESCFSEIIGNDNIKAESKTHLAQRWAEETNPRSVLFIGDTLHDAESAIATLTSAECFLVAGGHQSREALENSGMPNVKVFGSIIEAMNCALGTLNGLIN